MLSGNFGKVGIFGKSESEILKSRNRESESAISPPTPQPCFEAHFKND